MKHASLFGAIKNVAMSITNHSDFSDRFSSIQEYSNNADNDLCHGHFLNMQ